ncbi:MAG: sigma-70 family RNA polymerase sigma factor [Candidatus Omnitrophota bacterium]|jgi:RNA polymerase sigma factor (sigma-70 family)
MNDEFERLIKKLSPAIRGISHRMNGHFAFFSDEDLCQEALAYLWISFQNRKLENKTDSYILQGCYYHLKNYIRVSADKARLISMETPIDDEGTMMKDVISSKEEFAYNGAEERGAPESIDVYGLSEREKEVVNLSLKGLTTREIGFELKVSHVAIVKMKRRIRRKCAILEKYLKKGYQN